MRRLFAFLLVCVISTPALAQSKHPFTFEDMMKLKRVGEPVPSPDGKWVLFSVVDVNLEANTKTPHIWIVPLQPFHVGKEEKVIGGIPRNELSLQKTDSERILIADQDGTRPRWAPDGKRFAFISNKESGSQVWIADFDSAAGKVTRTFRLTKIATEADGELWSPDGKRIVFVSRVYPECDGEPIAEAACNERKLKEAEQSKVKAIVTERLFYRHWNTYTDGRRSHLFVIGTEGPMFVQVYSGPGPILPADITPGDYDTPPFSLGGQDNYAFSPDGQEIAYTSNHDKVEATSTNNDLWLVSANGGPAKNITADNPASDSTPLYSPDGKYIAYRAQQRAGYESDRFRLMLYDRKTGQKKNLTENFDRWVGTYAWAPSSVRLFFAAEDKGESPIYTIEAEPEAEGQPKEVLRGFNDDITVTRDYTLFFTRMSVQAPNEIWFLKDTPDLKFAECDLHPENLTPKQRKKNDEACSARGKRQVAQLTHSDSVFSQTQMQSLETFWFSGANGDKVQGFLVKPPDFDANKKYPVKFLIHGGPQGAWGDDWSYRWNPELFAANGYVVIMINFHGSTGYGQKFIDEINGNWGGAPFEDLMKGLDYAEKTYPFIDKDRECALGASYGGYMTNWILGHTNRFKCIVTHDGMFNTTSAWGTTEELWFNEWEFKGTPYTNREMYDQWSPHLSATNFKTPTLVVHGQLDYRLDVSEGFQLFTTLQRQGVPSKMLYFPDEGHWVLKPQNSQLWYKTVNDWVDRWVGGGQ
jgi:dipeptidyl aminopeptidase/acylaminoacyl peptidase